MSNVTTTITTTTTTGLQFLIIDNYDPKNTQKDPPKPSEEQQFLYQTHQIHTLSPFEFIHSKIAQKYNSEKHNLNVSIWTRQQFINKKVNSVTADGLIGKHRKVCISEPIDIKIYSDWAASGKKHYMERSATISGGQRPKLWEKKLPSQRFASKSLESSGNMWPSRLNSSSNLSQSCQGFFISNLADSDDGDDDEK